MSHNIDYYYYPEKVSKEKVYAELNNMVEHIDWQEGGHLDKIRWLDIVCKDSESAEQYIKEHDRGWYDNIAVKYKEYEEVKATAKLKDLEERKNKYLREIEESRRTLFFKDFKAEYLTCPGCGSKLKRELLRSERCPLCSTFMGSETLTKQRASLKARYEKACKDYNEEYKRLESKQKFKIMWMVKIEYHT